MLARLCLACFAGTLVFAVPANAQTFTRITDPTNPIATDPASPAMFAGASWMDFDGDGHSDLFVSNLGLYRNLGGGVFTKVNVPQNTTRLGNSWADVDNDGDLDLATVGVAGFGGARLFLNQGPAGFARMLDGVLADSIGLAGWACAWGDYDADGRVDLVITGFGNATQRNSLIRNLGGGLFARDNSTDVTVDPAPHTVPSWSDFDLDGDLDLSIGAGPANGTLGPDFFYRNAGAGAIPRLDRITSGALATDVRDGQICNWIDYDNDGDLDVYITNYNSQANHLYRNDAGTLVRVLDAGPIVTDVGVNTASVWSDFDNDGDLDCFVSRGPNRYYRNEGNGTFTSVVLSLTQVGSYTAAAADYDEDGDVDLFLNASATTSKGLYRNDLAPGRHWLRVRLTGAASNRAAIGARIRVHATIGGQAVWQLREVSAQNSFNGHSDLELHVGLGDAIGIDSLEVTWPSGRQELLRDVAVDRRLNLIEGDSPTPVAVSLVQADVTGRDVSLVWYASGDLPAGTVVQRASGADGPWRALGPATESGDRVTYVDRDAPAGRLRYRLAWLEEGGERSSAAVEVEVFDLALAVRAIGLDGARVAFMLPKPGGARLDVLDLSGRRLQHIDLGVLPAGRHTRELANPAPAGVYFLRLSTPTHSVTSRMVVVD